MGDYKKGEFAVQIVAILAGLFLLGLQIAAFVEFDGFRDDLRIALGVYFIILAIVTILMELPEQMKAEGIQNGVAKYLSMYKDPITRGIWYIIQCVFVCCYFSNHVNQSRQGELFAFAICYLICGIIFLVAGLLGIITEVCKK